MGCEVHHYAIFSTISSEIKECVELYLHSPIHLHGAVLSEIKGQLYLLSLHEGVWGSGG
jgi:hypothetical protein